jgi:hypothetical protein
MSDEDNMALNVDEEVVADTTPVSEATEEVEEEAVESAEDTEESETETGEEVQSKKGFSNRVRELNNRAKQAEEQVKSLSQRISELTANSAESEPYTPNIQPGAEITQEQYQGDIARAADSIVNLRLKQQQAVSQIQSDTQDVVRTHPELDPESDSYDEDLSLAVTEAVEARVRSNPYGANVKGFVDNLMKPYKRSVAKSVGKAGENLAKQVSQAAVKPTSVRSNQKTIEEKSIDELEKELGVYQS